MRAIINTRLKREAVFTMIAKRQSKKRWQRIVFGCLFAVIGALSLIAPTSKVYADPVVDDATVETVTPEETAQVVGQSCEDSLGALGWLVCPTTGKISEAVDWLYDKIEDILVINPVEMKDGTPIYEIWKYMRGVTNIVFIIFLLVVIYSQLTGVGISNYGIKKVLPKLIVVAILVNLSYVICSLAVDLSNVIGSSLRGVFTSIEESTLATMQVGEGARVSISSMYASLADGAALAVGAGIIAFETGAIWMLIPVVLGAVVAVASGLITIALRQAVVALLVMISPLAIVAYMLPNTEDLFKKWKKLLTRMLVFYPMFSLLFGASSLAGWAIITSASDGFWVMLGVAVQIFPLFFSWSLMKMSGTVLGTINSKITGFMAKPLATNRAWANSHREEMRQRNLASGKAYTPSLRLMQFMSNRRIAREAETKEYAATVQNRALAYNASRHYKKDGTPSRDGEAAYEMQARNMRYQRTILRDKNNFNKGLGYLAAEGTVQRARLDALDIENVNASDYLKIEQARGEKIDYDNAMGFHKRMEDAINAHFDQLNAGRNDYKTHEIADRASAMTRYGEAKAIMEGNLQDVQYAAATAAQAYDTQAKILMTKYQKYFELTPPTRDVEYRLGELTRLSLEELNSGYHASERIDAIIPGLRILNQRGDTDLVKAQLDNLLDKGLGGGIELGTHASQALASFLMFEVKDNDPFLRRFGKYINLETARAYNANDRKVMDVTYDEYIRGYHDGEPDLVTPDNPTGRMYAKKDMKKLVEGTSLDNVERTAFANLDESLKKAYGYDAEHPDKEWDVSGWLRKREEIQTSFEPAFLSASLKWLSGSEQINSGVKFWTGYDLKQQKNPDGTIMTDENGDPVYDLSPVWTGKEFAGHEDEVEKYFRRKTMDYFKDQTTGQILGMRTDYRDATMEHLVETYLRSSSNDLPSSKRREDFEVARAEIQSRYGDKTPEEAKKLRAKDLKALKMKIASKQIRKILGETGKLEQIYRTRRSGAANNAKDWLRGWVGLDDEEEMYKEVEFYEKLRRDSQAPEGGADSGDDGGATRIYGEADRGRFLDELDKTWEENKDVSAADFYKVAMTKIAEWFGGKASMVEYEFRKYYEKHEREHSFEAYNLKSELERLLHDSSKYPDA